MPEAITTSTGRQGAGTRIHLARLEAREDQALSVLTSRLRGIQANVQQDMDVLLARVARAREAGEDMSPSWLYRERRYRLVLQRLEDDLVEAMAATAEEAEVVRQVAATRGRQFAGSAIGVEGTMSDWSPEAMRAVLAGAEGPTPLAALLQSLAGESVEAVRVALITGVATGKGVPWMARRVAQGLDVPRWRAETIVRTESMRAFRHATLASFQEAPDVVAEWTWTAALDSRTCVACVAMHGTTHPLWNTLDGHPRCRCVMVPRTVDWDDVLGEGHGLEETRPEVETGAAWLDRQPEAVQRAVLGPAKFTAWKEGGVTLGDMVAQVESDTWGTMRREASLREIARGRGVDVKALLSSTPVDPLAALRDFSGLGVSPAREAMLRDYVDQLLGKDYRITAAQVVYQKADDAVEVARRVYDHQRTPATPWSPTAGPSESMRDAVGKVNPNWRAPGAHEAGWQTNCTRCTYAYEARRRGIPAKAKPLPPGKGYALDRTMTETAWNISPDTIRNQTPARWDSVEKALRGMPDGARGAISCSWKTGGGHIWNWEKVDGQVVWVDAQTGEVLTPEQKAERKKAGKQPSWVRLDDLPLTTEVRDFLDLE